jgi:hypothetical protein
VVARIGVEPALDSSRCHLKRLATRSGLNGLEVQSLERTVAYERFNLRRDFRVKGLFEPPFWAASWEAACAASSCASPHDSQASQ